MKYVILLLSCLPYLLNAQKSSKLNIELYLEIQAIEEQARNTTFVPVLIKGDLNQIESLVKENGGQYKYGVKNIASAQISLATVEKLLKAPSVQRIEYRTAQGHQLNYDQDTIAAFNNNMTNVHLGAGLPQSFQGEGVLLGVIDDGFEWRHPDFINADSSTRILHLWDQTSSDQNFFEQQYGYGASWDSMNLNAYQCSHVVGGHGSHVMGTAGGNARAANKYIGVAPKADLAGVRIAGGANFLTGFVDGLNFLFDKADASGQVCPVNSSVGAYSSGHDGLDLYAQLIDNLLTAKAGRALIQAGGNARGDNFHLGGNLNGNTSKTWFKHHNSANRTHFFMYADTAELANVNFSLELINPTTQQVEAQSPVYNIQQGFIYNGSVASVSHVLFYDNNNPVVLEIYADQYEDSYELYFRLLSNTNLGHLQLTTTGTGKFDIWSSLEHIGTSDMVMNAGVPNYQSPDDKQSIVGYWTCSDKVITVASYQNRDEMVRWGGDTVDISYPAYPQFGISHFSSLGPTRKGLQKPDITAPGGQVLSAAPLGTLSSYKISNDARLDVAGWHVVNRGTSMAAPMVTGAAALYLQCKPYANVLDIKQALEGSARVDSMVLNETFAVPNNHWGYGKLDVYKLMESCLIYGCKDTAALNYNPFATVSDSSCFYIGTGVDRLEHQASLQAYPNPVFNQARVDFQLPTNRPLENANLTLYNALGQAVFYQTINQHKGSIQIEAKNLPKGTYWLLLENEGKKYAHQQLIYL